MRSENITLPLSNCHNFVTDTGGFGAKKPFFSSLKKQILVKKFPRVLKKGRLFFTFYVLPFTFYAAKLF
jgi:hypothetical protein